MNFDYIPKINLRQEQLVSTERIYFDYPVNVKVTQESNTNTVNIPKLQTQGPDDFISYSETPNVRIDPEAFLEKFSNTNPVNMN